MVIQLSEAVLMIVAKLRQGQMEVHASTLILSRCHWLSIFFFFRLSLSLLMPSLPVKTVDGLPTEKLLDILRGVMNALAIENVVTRSNIYTTLISLLALTKVEKTTTRLPFPFLILFFLSV
jgi:hypothetical protein